MIHLSLNARFSGLLARRSPDKQVCKLFTGIVQGKAIVQKLVREEHLTKFELKFPEDLSDKVFVGSSVAINGVCLSATSVQRDTLSFDTMLETLRVTNLSDLKEESRVNYEKSAKLGDEIGGHILSGHVHTIAEVSEISSSSNYCKMTFHLDKEWMKYILSKGFVAVDGISLTACETTEDEFSVYLIPETLRVTTLGEKKIGDSVNIEVEAQTQAIVDTVERIIPRYLAKLG